MLSNEKKIFLITFFLPRWPRLWANIGTVTEAVIIRPQLSTCQTRKVACGAILKVTISSKVFSLVWPILISLVVNKRPREVTIQWKSSRSKLLRTWRIIFSPNLGFLVELVICSWDPNGFNLGGRRIRLEVPSVLRSPKLNCRMAWSLIFWKPNR